MNNEITNNIINNENWTHSHYKAKNLKAMITFGASPEILDDSFLYFATVLDEEHNEVHQSEFDNLDAACHFINNKYLDTWEFVDAQAPKKEGGCSTCVAH